MSDNIENNDNIKSDETKDDDTTTKNIFCFICRRDEENAGPMVRLPIGVYVCKDCMQNAINGMKMMDSSDFDKDKLANFNISDFNYQNFRDNFLNSMSSSNEQSQEEKETDKEKQEDTKVDMLDNLLLPHQIKEGLDEYVIGQEYAKKVISVAVYNHYKRIKNSKNEQRDVEIEKSNILMLGPTGSGKTYLVQTLAKLLNVPLALADATSLTEAGYIGDDIESVLSKLLSAAKGNVKKAEQGIVFIDEIDKIAKKKNTNQRDVSGESVQQAMLKLLEGANIEVPVGATSKSAMVPLKTMNTNNILFICGGAFPGIEEIIKERLNKQSSIGFIADLKDKYDNEENILKYVEVEDIRKFGMIPEFIGRLPIICYLQELTKEMMITIMKEPKNAILKQYCSLLEMDEVKLDFSDDALDLIAQKAIEKKTGARALRAIIEEFMLDIMYEIPKDDNIGKVTITADYINKKTGPNIEMRSIGRIGTN